MLIPDEERFEAYLKQFTPLAPEPLLIERHVRATRRSFALAAWAGAAVAIVVVAFFALHSRAGRPRSGQAMESLSRTEQLVRAQPLTIRSANALLAPAPSFKAAFDEIAFQPQAAPASKDQRSALAELAKERQSYENVAIVLIDDPERSPVVRGSVWPATSDDRPQCCVALLVGFRSNAGFGDHRPASTAPFLTTI